MGDNIHKEGAREALMRGIKKAADTIAGTLGPTGYSIIVESPLYPGHAIYDDGWLALDAIKLDDPLEQRGVELLKEAVRKSNKESGDGSTTTTILTAAILEEGMKTGLNGREIKQSLDECLPIIEASLKDQTEQIAPEEVAPVATIASGDPEIGNLLQDIYTQIGKDGLVELDNSGTPVTSYEIIEGVRLHNAGFLHEMFTNDGGKGRTATLMQPHVLITKQPINSSREIDPLLTQLLSAGVTQLVIFYKEISDQILQYLAEGHMQGRFKFLLIKAPALWQDWLFEDLAIITGAKIIDPSMGYNLASLQRKWLGTCEKIVAHKNETLVFPHPEMLAKDSLFEKHLEKLQEDGKTDDQQLLRASWLKTRTAILKIGANSESELSLKRAKIEDARNAAYQALQSGIVEGAGMALLKASKMLPDSIGGNILRASLAVPHAQLIDNMGVDQINTKDVVDPAAIPLNAIKNAISVAGAVLTSNAVITLPQKV